MAHPVAVRAVLARAYLRRSLAEHGVPKVCLKSASARARRSREYLKDMAALFSYSLDCPPSLSCRPAFLALLMSRARWAASASNDCSSNLAASQTFDEAVPLLADARRMAAEVRARFLASWRNVIVCKQR